ncbi:hypothetical protein [Gallaecimonas sp. GXIMD4217]|uniref:hypothetical protein n=1 Tax=Gallaecimonas sp. GXIMD4217 TaxID=3131927 RepID=UPI00311AF710
MRVWLYRLFFMLILVLVYTYGLTLIMYLVGTNVPRFPVLAWLGDPVQPWSLLLVTLGMQLLSVPTAYAIARLEEELPNWLAFMVAVPGPAMMLFPDWQAQLSVLGYVGEPLAELLSLPLWTWWLSRRLKRRAAARGDFQA